MDRMVEHTHMTIKEIITTKRCSSCGGKFLLENAVVGEDVHETLYCENFCFTRTKIKKPTGTWCKYLKKNGKLYLSSNSDRSYRETYLYEDKHGVRVMKGLVKYAF